jgi:hypothetical protein
VRYRTIGCQAASAAYVYASRVGTVHGRGRRVRRFFGAAQYRQKRVTPLALLLVFVLGCESDTKKLDRLREDAAIASLAEMQAREGGNVDSINAAIGRRMLADRALKKFMDGR